MWPPTPTTPCDDPSCWLCCSILVLHQPPLQIPPPLGGWYAGFFDADGTVVFYQHPIHERVRFNVSVTNKHHWDVEYWPMVFGGKVYEDRANGATGKWVLQAKKGVLAFVDFVETNPDLFRSHKAQRFGLIKPMLALVEVGAHKKGHPLHHQWEQKVRQWNDLNQKKRPLLKPLFQVLG